MDVVLQSSDRSMNAYSNESAHAAMTSSGGVNDVTVGARRGRVQLRAINDNITCSICQGYLIDAHTLRRCMHSCKWSAYDGVNVCDVIFQDACCEFNIWDKFA